VGALATDVADGAGGVVVSFSAAAGEDAAPAVQALLLAAVPSLAASAPALWSARVRCWAAAAACGERHALYACHGLPPASLPAPSAALTLLLGNVSAALAAVQAALVSALAGALGCAPDAIAVSGVGGKAIMASVGVVLCALSAGGGKAERALSALGPTTAPAGLAWRAGAALPRGATSPSCAAAATRCVAVAT
jgi:hypothetical protein